MIKRLTIAAMLLSLTLMIGCGPSDPHERVIEDAIDCWEKTIEILVTVTDKASAEAAKPKLEAIEKRIRTLAKQEDEVGKPDEAKRKALAGKYEERVQGVLMKTVKEMTRVRRIPGCSAVLDRVMANIGVRPRGSAPGFGDRHSSETLRRIDPKNL
jgi:hypothetical protein